MRLVINKSASHEDGTVVVEARSQEVVKVTKGGMHHDRRVLCG